MTYEEEFKGTWEQTEIPHIWYSPDRNVYTCENEANMFFGIYTTMFEAMSALADYCEKYL